ncbi:zinc finger matrin-type protein 4-like [Oncorhynchus tshawytscha]|uniref:zinc finger matrin-type protein 4-like n=1 Tax=Oncorhynchus tshawytscha TaxID=74940 RepID=UPI001C3DBF0F|nr:zinc finger matrin-type protein 4-like [Oncorhynchus tshawytscha]
MEQLLRRFLYHDTDSVVYGSAETEVDRNKCCTLCNMFFTSAIVAQSHYQGKTHAKRVRLVLGETPSIPTTTNSPTTTDSSPSTPQPSDSTPPHASPALPWPSSLAPPVAVVGSGGGSGETGKYCCLCGAWFNNPLMAQQHYEGKKHRRNAARVRLLEQLAGSLDATETTGYFLSDVDMEELEVHDLLHYSPIDADVGLLDSPIPVVHNQLLCLADFEGKVVPGP